MSRSDVPKVAIAPDPDVAWMVEAVTDGGGEIAALEDADAIVWLDPDDPEGLASAVRRAPDAQWIQLPFAGVESFLPFLERQRTWTCGKGVYADPVAELALALGLGGLRGFGGYVRARTWTASSGRSLVGGRVTILGGGGIAESLIRMLAPFDCHVTVVRSTVDHMDGVDVVLESDRYADALPGADLVVLALPLTDETVGIIGAGELEMMESHAWLVNVARGQHVVTDDLVAALSDGVIGGAGLDVTDPEPLPDDHPLWSLENCVITPHTGATPDMWKPLLAERVRTNVRRFGAGQPLVGLVDLEAGY
jgi:phosphoglycerate dehydrogenase-like enzyme